MAKFGERSEREIATLDPDLQTILHEAIQVIDFAVYQGHRSNADQEKAYLSGHSQLKAGQSKHNLDPSRAVDLWKYPIDWEDTDGQSLVAGVILGIAHSMDIPLRWGGDWDRDGDTDDNGFNDLPHFELI